MLLSYTNQYFQKWNHSIIKIVRTKEVASIRINFGISNILFWRKTHKKFGKRLNQMKSKAYNLLILKLFKGGNKESQLSKAKYV